MVELDVHLILDNYGTHKTATIHRWLLKRPRFHLHFTPTGASWLNLVERWFGFLTQQQLRRGVFRSTRNLETTIRNYIDNHNEEPKAVHLDQNRRRDSRHRGEILSANFRDTTLGREIECLRKNVSEEDCADKHMTYASGAAPHSRNTEV